MGIYTVGMHRSGTSALARFIGLLVGYEAKPNVSPHNTAGQWEDSRLNASLDRVLRSMGSDWASPPLEPIELQDLQRASEVAEITYIINSFGDGSWVLKNPRLCLALGALLTVPQPSTALVATYRHPMEVAGSLRSRDGYPLTYGLALWEVYTRCLLHQLKGAGVPWTLVSYEDLLDRPTEQASVIGGYLNDRGHVVTPPAMEAAAASISSGLKHESSHDDSLMTRAQHTLLEQLEGLKEDRSATIDRIPDLSRWTRDIIEVRRPYGPMERNYRILQRRTRRVAPLFRVYDGVRRRMHLATPVDPWK